MEWSQPQYVSVARMRYAHCKVILKDMVELIKKIKTIVNNINSNHGHNVMNVFENLKFIYFPQHLYSLY